MVSEKELFSYHTAPNGLRVVHRLAPGALVDYCGVSVNAGSRDESPDREGLAHFVEHTIFKGTDRRRSMHILNRMEAVGGELNAYTTKEETVIYTIAPAGNLGRSVDLLADLILNSRFPKVEIDREREVVADEINSYLDNPSEAIFDDFDDLVFAGSSLGHNILGSVESIQRFGPEECRHWLDEFYTPTEMVFFYMGAKPAQTVFKTVERYFAPLKYPDHGRVRLTPAPVAPFDVVRPIGSHQAHTVLGARIPGLHSPRRYAVAMLTNILGGPGMNSLLNVELREKRGLVYSVDATTQLYGDLGLFTIYFGCDPGDTDRCLRLTARVLDSLAQSPMSPSKLERARRQYIGQMAVAGENREQQALSTGRSVLIYDRVRGVGETIEIINSLTADDLLEAARGIVNTSRLTFC